MLFAVHKTVLRGTALYGADHAKSLLSVIQALHGGGRGDDDDHGAIMVARSDVHLHA